MATGNEIRRFQQYVDPIWSLSLSPDGNSLITGSGDVYAWSAQIRGANKHVWDLRAGMPSKDFRIGQDQCVALTVNMDGKLLNLGADLNDNDTLRFWDTNTSKLIRSFKGHKECYSFAAA